MKHNKYSRVIRSETVDVYDVLAAFDVTCQHCNTLSKKRCVLVYVVTRTGKRILLRYWSLQSVRFSYAKTFLIFFLRTSFPTKPVANS